MFDSWVLKSLSGLNVLITLVSHAYLLMRRVLAYCGLP